MPPPPTTSADAGVLTIAARCRLLTRDVLATATGCSYEAAGRAIARLTKQPRPFLASLDAGETATNGRAARRLALTAAGQAALREAGTLPIPTIDAHPAVERDEPTGTARKVRDAVRRQDWAALTSALLLRLQANDPGLAVTHLLPGSDADLWVADWAVRGALSSEGYALVEPVPAGITYDQLQVAPDLLAHLHIDGGLPDGCEAALVAFAGPGEGDEGAVQLVVDVAITCALWHTLQVGGALGPLACDPHTRLRILVWLPTPDCESWFHCDLSTALRWGHHLVATTNGELLPLALPRDKAARTKMIQELADTFCASPWLPVSPVGIGRLSLRDWIAGPLTRERGASVPCAREDARQPTPLRRRGPRRGRHHGRRAAPTRNCW